MKKQTKKLKLSVETLRELSLPQVPEIAGGATIVSCGGSCPEYWTCPYC